MALEGGSRPGVETKLADDLVERANRMQMEGRFEEALVAYREALSCDPRHGSAQANLGLALVSCHRLEEAVEQLHRALELMPACATIHYNLANALGALGALAEAEASWLRAMELDPAFVPAYVNLAAMLMACGRQEEGIVLYSRALTVDPRCAPAWLALGNIFLGRGQVEDAVLCYRRTLEIQPDLWGVHSNLIFALDQDLTTSAADTLAERRRWNEQHALPLAATWAPHSNLADPEKRLRIGYVSGEFRHHSAAFCALPVILAHERKRFEVYCYSSNSHEDAVTARFRDGADAWRAIHDLDDERVARLIREDGIDILVDLSGHTGDHRLLVFARKPAPVQVSAWGYATGTGLSAMDYLFGDDVTTPPEMDPCYVEKVWRLPCIITLEPPQDAPDVGPLPALERGHVTYGSLNRFSKVDPRVLEVWAEILKRSPTARLVLKDVSFDSEGTRQAVLARFRALGVESHRVTLLGGTSRFLHLGAYHGIDVALDPFPQGGGITTLESLFMGVPVVTRMMEKTVSRVCTSLLGQVGLAEEFSTTSDEAYVRAALDRGADLGHLAAIREGLRSRLLAAPVCNAALYCSAVEEAYRAIWRRWCAEGCTDRTGARRQGC